MLNNLSRGYYLILTWCLNNFLQFNEALVLLFCLNHKIAPFFPDDVKFLIKMVNLSDFLVQNI